MPFTPAHTLAVLPLVRWRKQLLLDPTCLVIGSMAPDFEYFVRARRSGGYGHSVLGIALWCIPVTIALAVTYHHLVKWTMLMALPARVSRRAVSVVGRAWDHDWRGVGTLVSLVVSAAIGAATHLAWDGVTHSDGWTVERVEFLRTTYAMPWGRAPLHRIVQHASSVLGLLAVGYFVARAIRRAPPVALPELSRTRPRLIFAACTMTIVGLTFSRLWRIQNFDAPDLIVATISALLGGAIVTSLVVRDQTIEFRDGVTLRA